MKDLWLDYGFVLWALTTALALIALAWLTWTTFFTPGPEEGPPRGGAAAPRDYPGLASPLSEVREAFPLVQASVGRALQYVGLESATGPDGAPGFALAAANGRGDGFVLSQTPGRPVSLAPLSAWTLGTGARTSPEERVAVERARAQAKAAIEQVFDPQV